MCCSLCPCWGLTLRCVVSVLVLVSDCLEPQPDVECSDQKVEWSQLQLLQLNHRRSLWKWFGNGTFSPDLVWTQPKGWFSSLTVSLVQLQNYLCLDRQINDKKSFFFSYYCQLCLGRVCKTAALCRRPHHTSDDVQCNSSASPVIFSYMLKSHFRILVSQAAYTLQDWEKEKQADKVAGQTKKAQEDVCVCVLSFIQKGTVCAMRWGVEMKEGGEERTCEVSLYSPPALRASCPSGPKQEKDRRWNEEGPEEVLTASGIAPCQLYSASLLSGSKFLKPFFSLLCLLLSCVQPQCFTALSTSSFLPRLVPVNLWLIAVDVTFCAVYFLCSPLVTDFWLPPFVLFPSFVNLLCFARVLLISLRIDAKIE